MENNSTIGFMHLTTYDLDIFNDNMNSEKWNKKEMVYYQNCISEKYCYANEIISSNTNSWS